MHLSEQNSKLFFTVYYPLHYYSFSDFEEIGFEEFFESGINNQILARDNIFKNRTIIDDYIDALTKQSKSAVDDTKLDLLRAIQKARITDFIAVKKDDTVYLIDLDKNKDISDYEPYTGTMGTYNEVSLLHPRRSSSSGMSSYPTD